jgi:hypothetical protein
MGAHSFTTVEFGRDIRDAYRRACDRAEYDFGHDPYNGTISTTRGVREFELPTGRLDWQKVVDAAFAVSDARGYDKKWIDWDRLVANRAPLKPKRSDFAADAEWRYREAVCDWEEKKRLRADLRALNPAGRRLAIRIGSEIEKWGPAVGFALRGKQATDMRKRMGMQGRRGSVYVLFGMAAS